MNNNNTNSSEGKSVPQSNPGWKPTGGYNIGSALKTVYCKDHKCPDSNDKCPGHKEWDYTQPLMFD